MHVKTLHIENFRGIRNMELELHPRMNVLIGVNGAGKSSVLDALGYLMTPPVRFLSDQAKDINDVFGTFGGNDYPRYEASRRGSSLHCTISKEGLEEMSWNMQTIDGFRLPPASDRIGLQKNDFRRFFTRGKDDSNIGLIVYYRVHRKVDNISIDAWTDRNFRKKDAFVDALAPTIDFKEFFQWFRNREDLENEERADGGSKSDLSLDSVRNVIKAFLDTVSDVRIRRRNPLRMVVKKNEEELRIEQLSDGEKCLLAMVGDLARRMTIASPELEDDPLHGEGIVLIDEIDLHLHPQWQRMILPKLLEIFPNTQFIVTTHSPQVVGEIKQGQGKIIPLQDGGNGIEALPGDFNAFGQTSDVILADVMKTPKRNDEIATALREVFNAIDANDLTVARNKKEELEKMAGGIPELAKIELLLHRKERFGK